MALIEKTPRIFSQSQLDSAERLVDKKRIQDNRETYILDFFII
jgi:hypothetical protein